MKGWVSLVGWPIADGLAYPHKWSPFSCRSSMGQESSPVKDRRSTTVPSNHRLSMLLCLFHFNVQVCHMCSHNQQTSIQTDVAKGHIANMSPFVAPNGFVWSWPHLIHGSLDRQELSRHNRFSRFCTVHPSDRHTDRHTDHATCDICSNRPHLVHCMHAMR